MRKTKPHYIAMRTAKGLHPKAAKVLKGKPIIPLGIDLLRGVQPPRQIAMARLMVGMNDFTRVFVHALVLCTPVNQLLRGNAEKELSGIPAIELARMENEMKSLEHDFNEARSRYGMSMLELTVIEGYVRRLLQNKRISGFLKSRYPELLLEIETAVALRTH